MLLLHLRRVLFFGLLGLIVATAWILFSKPIYEARLALQVGVSGQQGQDPFIPPDVQAILSKADSQQAATEVDILRQESLFAEALQHVAEAQSITPPIDPTTHGPYPNFDRQLVDHYKSYYRMYAVTGGPVQPDQSPQTISSLAEITVRAYDPQTAIDLANEIGKVYTDTRQRNLKEANITAENNLNRQIIFYKNSLDELDSELEKAKSNTGVSDLPLIAREVEDYVSTLQNKKDALQADLNGSELELSRLKDEFKAIKPRMSGASSKIRNNAIELLNEKLSVASAELASRKRTYLPNAREVQQVQDQIDSLNADMAAAKAAAMHEQDTTDQPNPLYDQLKGQIVTATAHVDSLRAQLNDVNQQYSVQKAKEAKLPSSERTINSIQRKRDLTEQKYKTIRAAHDAIENRINAAALPAVIMSMPMLQFVKDPVEPNVPRTILIGLLAGVALGAIFTAARESIKPLVFSATQLEQATGLPVVATMPKLPGGEVQRVKTLINSSRFPRKNFHDMASVVLAERESLPKTIVVCGVDGDSSSSLAAISYAAALARAGLRVTLVDANPAKVITRAFDLESENGIVDYLTQSALISQKALGQFSMLTKDNEQLGCKICAYGVADVTTLTDFSDDRVAGIIEALKPETDVLIIETAPSGRQPDAVRMARHADEVLATFESGTSSDRSVDTLRDLFAEAGVKKMSMVLTNTLERVA